MQPLKRLLWALLGAAGLGLWTTAQAQPLGSPAVALYYGHSIPLTEWRAFDIVVVEADHGHDPKTWRERGLELYAYASVAEAHPSRPYHARIPAAWKMARNGAWRTDVIDQTPAEWPEFFANEVVGPLWAKGYRGFFLDTLDSYRLAQQFDEAAQQDGLVRLLETLHRRFPGIRLILNRGFEILPRVPGKVQMVAAESLYRRWNAQAQRYEEVPENDRAWLLQQLHTAKERDGVPGLVIDYVPPHQRDLTRKTVEQIRAHGLTPWVTDSQLHTIGMGAIEPVPRRILILYNGGESPAVRYSNPHLYLQMPLNHLGYVVDYADARQPLPEGVLADRYAGVVTWFSGFLPEPNRRPVSRWLQARMAEGMPVAILGDLGLAPDRALAQRLGLLVGAEAPRAPLRILRQDPMMGFEISLDNLEQAEPFRLDNLVGREARPLLQFRDAKGQEFTGAALMPWGGLALDPYVLAKVPGTEFARWVMDPFAFVTQALRLEPLPIPDITTENGRRLLLAHIDGDGFPSRAELAGSPLAPAVLLKDVLERYKVPTAMSVIEGETAPHGLYPADSKEMEDIARRMFRLPHVELASHSYAHPFLWDPSVRHGRFLEDANAAYHLDLPGYQMDLHREIVGSSQYINERLAPPGKKVKIMLWSGDTAPNARALEITENAGLLNMNGGNTTITKANPSITAIGAHGLLLGEQLQVYAPITNENLFTNLWRGPFYGYERVLETFEMTDKPRRIKPVGIYYHTYSASKRAGLRALHKVYDWAISQPLHPVYPSEFIQKVRDFHSHALAKEGGGWRVRGDGHLRTLRLPTALGTPLLDQSHHVAGYLQGAEGLYVHLSGPNAWLRTTNTPVTPSGPYLTDANARLVSWKVSDGGKRVEAQFSGHGPIEVGFGSMTGCSAHLDQRPIPPAVPPRGLGANVPGQVHYRIPHAAAQVVLQCASR
ncbi:MAG: bifunctional glycoside hydrolase 114/ polysaccharide deacetylase family protein [Burkholderiaceae bacterium]